MNAFNDFASLTAAQLGEGIRWTQDGSEFNYSRDTARRVWDAYYVPHIKGWYESRTYNQDGIKSGRLMAYIGSSAGAGFFPQVVIEDEKQSHPIACGSYAYPVFQGGTPYMGQRGSNMAVFSTDESHQQAAVRFLKWFTEPEQNIRFAVATGYLPVQEKALESVSDWWPMWKAGTMSRQWRRASRHHLMPWKTIMYMSAKPFRGLMTWTRYFHIPGELYERGFGNPEAADGKR